MPLTREQFRRAREAGKSVDDIITFENRNKTSVTRFLPKEQEVERIISERTDPVTPLEEEVALPFTGGLLKRGIKAAITTGKLSAAVTGRASAGVGGLLRGIQKPGTSLKEIGEMGKAGLFGRKQFRALDFARASGLPSIAASVGEFALEVAVPLKILGSLGKVFKGPITRASDKKLLEAGNKLVQASDDAITAAGKPLTQAYTPINARSVNPKEIIEEIAELPPQITRHLERKIGENFDEFFDNFTIEKARKLKGWLGELKPTSFGKTDVGRIDQVIDIQVNKAYSTIKKSMQKSIPNQKQAKALLEADDAFTETMNASRLIKKTITDPTLREPTRAGRAASGLAKESDVTFRSAINILRKGNRDVRKSIDKTVSSLEAFNRAQKLKKLGGQSFFEHF